MQSINRYLIAMGISFGCISILYFLSLVFHIPFFIAVPVIIAGVIFVFKWVVISGDSATGKIGNLGWAYVFLITGLFFLVLNSIPFSLKYGGWDAWTMWDINARYMAGGFAQWKYLLMDSQAHPDYPLFVPAINGFFIRLFPAASPYFVVYIFDLIVMLFIPLLIYFETLRKNLVVAAIILLLFAFDKTYLSQSVSHYADIPLAFFFLCAMICTDATVESKKNIALAAACLGCCMWTKNEGVILGGILLAFNARLFFSVRNIKYTLLGLVAPLTALLVFKICFAPANDMVSGQNSGFVQLLFTGKRYAVIYQYFIGEMTNNFNSVGILFLGYILFCIAEKKWPDKQFFMLITCIAAYMFVYVLSPYDLDYHLNTSLQRLMLHIVPAMMYVFAMRFSRVQFVLSK